MIKIATACSAMTFGFALCLGDPAAAQDASSATPTCAEAAQYFRSDGYPLPNIDQAAAMAVADACVAAHGTADDYWRRAQLGFIARSPEAVRQARADLDRVIELAPERPEPYVQRGIFRGTPRGGPPEHEEAIADYRMALERGGFNPASLHVWIAARLNSLERWDEAIVEARLSQTYYAPGGYNALMDSYEGLGRWDAVVDVATEQADLWERTRHDLGRPDILVRRGVARLMMGDFQAALEDFDAELQRNVDSPYGPSRDALLGRGLALQALGRPEEAAEATEDAITSALGLGGFPEEWAALCRQHLEAGDQRAAALACSGGGYGYEEPSIMASIGLIYERSGEVDQAVHAYQRALELEPERSAVRNYLRERIQAESRRLAEEGLARLTAP